MSSQQPVKRRRDNSYNIAGSSRLSPFVADNCERRPGVITRMVLKNFMCHSHLEVDFHNNINYIIGKNGSGKSAILTALIVGLGGKASLTNRGNSIKGFVKAGQISGSIHITLHNVGLAAYEHHLYGDSITIVRTFSQSGGSAYRIKNHNQENVSTQSKEVTRITTAFHIQIDNPLCILNQDTSRNFLSSADPRMKYQLFMKGTRLELYYDTIKSIESNKQTSQRGIREKLKFREEKETEYEGLKLKLKQLRSLEDMKENVSKLELELMWSQVKDMESELTEKLRESSESEKKYAELLDISQNRDVRMEEAQSNINTLQKQIQDLRQEIVGQTRPQVDCKARIATLNKNLITKQRDRESLLRKKASKEADYTMCEDNIKKHTEKMTKKEKERLDRINTQAGHEIKLQEIRNMLRTTENEQFQSESDCKIKEEELKALHMELRNVSTNQGNIEEKIRGIVENEGNQLAVYGGHMPKLLELLQENSNRFHKLPIGPIAHYITIKDKKWALAIEGHTSSLLGAFLVDNAKDGALFRDLFKRHFPRVKEPSIITGALRENIPNQIDDYKVEAPSDCVAIIDAITVSSNPVFNTLLDHCNIESTLLIPSGERAVELLSHVKAVPRKCRLALTITGDKFYPDPNYKTYASTYRQVRYLQVDTSEIIRDLKVSLKELQEKQLDVKKRYASLKEEVNERRQNFGELRRHIEKLKSSEIRFKRLIQDLINMLEPETMNVQSMLNELQEIKQEIVEIQVLIENAEDETKQIEENITEENNSLKQLKSSTGGIEDRILPLQRDLEEQNSRKQELLVSVSYDKRRLNGCKEKMLASQKEKSDKEEELDRLGAQANSLGDRPDEIRAVQDIMETRNRLQRKIAAAEAQSGDPQEIAEQTRACKQRLDDITDILEVLKKDYSLLQNLYSTRKYTYRCVLDYFVSLMKFSFEGILRTRHFRGDMTINTMEKALDIVVLPRNGMHNHTSTANLSGGERSYSTVSFLYSLWQCLNFPFYFLDEFDVFMDKANRTAVMNILIEHAKNRPEAQFVFLTPQDVSFIKDPAVTIHRLDDPERKSLTQ